MAARTLDGAAWNATLFGADGHDVREFQGEVDFRGTPAYRVRMVSARGVESVHYFSVEEGWLIGTEAEVETPMGTLPSTTVVSEYREFGGVRFATRTVQEIGPAGTQILVVESVEDNDVPPGTFTVPDEIRTLLEP
jgi:hypothetical protein